MGISTGIRGVGGGAFTMVFMVSVFVSVAFVFVVVIVIGCGWCFFGSSSSIGVVSSSGGSDGMCVVSITPYGFF